jgi:Tol biopolymer transport system component
MPLAEHVAVNTGLYRAVFSSSDNGVLVYQGGASALGWRLFWTDRSGKQTALTSPARYLNPDLSPDGKRVAVAMGNTSGGNMDIWIFDMVRNIPTRLTFDTSNKNFPVWTPDGKRIFFSSDRTGAGTAGIFSKAADGSGSEETILSDGRYNSPNGFSPDGRYLVMEGTEPSSKTGLDISVLPMFGERKPYFIVQTQFTDVRPSIAPDGKWMAYQSDESGAMEIYLTPFPRGGPKWQVSTGRGAIPHWRGDGRELYFLGLDNRLYAVDVDLRGNSPQLGTPHTLFTTSAVAGPFGPYTASADGKHFLINGTESQQGSEPLTLVTNWPQELKK